jgi:hypothetical protein
MDYLHKRLLSIRLRLIEKCLFETTRLLEVTANDAHFILYSVKVNVDLDLRDRISKVSSLMIEQIQKMKQEFNLQSEEQEDSIKTIVLSNLNEAWSSIKDLREGKIHGHDQLSAQEKQLLNVHIIKLYTMIESIYRDISRF